MNTEPKVKNKRKKTAKFWVGLGASAGGLEAVRGLVRNLPKDLPATYILAQHMAPHHKSMLVDIIGRETDMAVLDVTDKLLPAANTIYITPPNSNVIVENNRLRLIDPSKAVAAPKPSVDTFFTSLAESKGKFAVGIILSGTGSDGAKGMTAIRDNGGITIAQDEMTAKYNSMPSSAIDTGFVDLIMSPEEMGAQFAKVVKLPRNLDALKASPINLDVVSELISLLHNQTKVNFKYYKTPTFQRRVDRRMAAVKVETLDEYVKVARESTAEVQALFQDLLISVTSFFRDTVEFDALRSHIKNLIERKNDEFIRLWIPGVATGEEAYSLSILFSEICREMEPARVCKMQIFATDIDANAIEIARRGYYPETALAAVPEDIIARYFDPAPSGYQVKKIIREKVVFSLHNIAQDPPFLKIDMISCRNLLIYFQATLQADVFARFHYSLVPNGLLFLGKSEAVATSESLFKQATPDKHIFFQRPSRERRLPHDMLHGRPSGFNSQSKRFHASAEAVKLQNSDLRFDMLVEGIGPNALLVNSDLDITKAYGDVSKYIGLTAGSVNTKATSLLKEPYRQDVQFTVPAVIRKNQKSIGIVRSDPIDAMSKQRISIYPIQGGMNEEAFALVVFEEWIDTKSDILSQNTLSADANSRVDELSNELAIVKTNLQQAVEELETTNEELQAVNEELQSSNEELQSTNEELETSNEELQSTNEELSTVNEELHVNSQQLSALNQSLHGILENIAVPLIVVNKNLDITQISHVTKNFFGISADLALPHISRCKAPDGFPDLSDCLQQAMESRSVLNFAIVSEGTSATMTVAPHFSSTDEIAGAIILVADNTQELIDTRNELQLIFDSVPEAIMVRDIEGKIIKANIATDKLLGLDLRQSEGQNSYEYLHEDSRLLIQSSDREILKSGVARLSEILHVHFTDGRSIWARISRIPVQEPGADTSVLYVVIQNITDEYEANINMQLNQRRLDVALKATLVEIWERDFTTGEAYWSDGIKQLAGLEVNDLSLTVEDFESRVHPNDIDSIRDVRKNHIEKNEPYHIQYRFKNFEDKYVWIESSAQAEWDDDGKLLRFTGTFMDITRQRSDLIDLFTRNNQLKLASDLSGVGYWNIDVIENTLFWSDLVYEIHGLTPEEYQPSINSSIEFYHPDDLKQIQTFVSKAIETGDGFEFHARLRHKDGEYRIVNAIGRPHQDKFGKTTNVFGVFQDVSADRLREEHLENTLEELSRSNYELNRFSYVCSHDMKEPVRMIEMMSSLLVNPEFQGGEDKRVELLQRIGNNTVRLREIIDNLLAFSRIDAKIEMGEVNLTEILNDIRKETFLEIEDQNASVTFSNLPNVWGAKIHFIQLFQNLIGNALKFNDKEKPVIKISGKQSEQGWIISVEDNGPGVPEESRATIFDLFNRLQRRDEIEGSGLGLSIVQKIINQYNGTIECKHSSLGGAKFEIFIKS